MPAVNVFAPMRYEVYVDGALGGGELAFWDPVTVNDSLFDPVINPGGANVYPALPDFSMTSGGVLSVNAPYNYASSPNILPKLRTAGVLGAVPTLNGSGKTVGASDWESAFPLFDMSGGTNLYGIASSIIGVSFDGAFAMPHTGPGTLTTMRYFLRTFTVRLQWTDGAAQVPLVGRAMAINRAGFGDEYHYNFGSSGSFELLGTRDTFRINGYSSEGAAYWPNDTVPWTLTDGSAIATYYGLLGIAVGFTNGSGSHVWSLFDPRGGDGFNYNIFPNPAPPHGDLQNVVLTTNVAEQAAPGGSVPLSHTFSQWQTDSSGPVNTPGWSIDYATAWDPATGMLACPKPALHTFNYSQNGLVTILEPMSGSTTAPPVRVVIPANITLTGHNGKVYTGTSGNPIAAIPDGSLLNDLRLPPNGDRTATITDFPLLSAASYPASSTLQQEPQVVFPGDGTERDLVYASKTATDLIGKLIVTTLDLRGIVQEINVQGDSGVFIGGEVVTEFYTVAWTEIGGSGRSGAGKLWVHEDQTRNLDLYAGANTGFSPVVVDVDTLGNQYAVFVPSGGPNAGRITIARKMGVEASWEYWPSVVGLNPWIECMESHSRGLVFVAFQAAGPSTMIVMWSEINGTGDWKANLVSVAGQSVFFRSDKALGRQLLTYWRIVGGGPNGNTYLLRSRDAFNTTLESEITVLTGLPQQVVTFDWLEDADRTMVAYYSDGTNILTKQSTDEGHTWV